MLLSSFLEVGKANTTVCEPGLWVVQAKNTYVIG
jgi:hypothetical protein